MIISTRAFTDQIGAIKEILLGENRTNFVFKKYKREDFVMDKGYYTDWYQRNMIELPLGTIARQDSFFLQDSFVRNYKFYNYYDQQERDEKEKRQILDEVAACEELDARFELDEAIDERMNNFMYYFKDAIKLMKKGPYFSHVKDIGLVIKNLLAYYEQVLNDSSVQLSFFSGVKMPFGVATAMLEVLVAVLREKMDILENDFSLKTPNAGISPEQFRFEWLGSQQDFAELITELQIKGFMSVPEDESVAGVARRLAGVFDFSASKRKSGSDISANLTTYLKPIYNPDISENEYFFQKAGYQRKFAGLPVSKNKKK